MSAFLVVLTFVLFIVGDALMRKVKAGESRLGDMTHEHHSPMLDVGSRHL